MEEVLEEMSERLYRSIRLKDGQIYIIDELSLARAYFIAMQLKESEIVDCELLNHQMRRFVREQRYNEAENERV